MDSPRKRLLLIDAHGLAFRAFYAVPAMFNKEGQGIQVLQGYLSILLKVLDSGYDYAVAAFDPPGLTFRDEMWEGYKAHRLATPADLIDQIQLCQKFTELLNIPAVLERGYEADDVLGTLARQAQAMGLETVILSSDKDLLQLVDDHTVMQTAYRDQDGSTVVFGPDQVRSKYGFEPRQMIDYKALVGDTSDNLPGVVGIGEKTATALIAQYGDLDSILAHITDMPQGRVRKALEGHSEEARFSQNMVTIVRDVPGVNLDLDRCRLGDFNREVMMKELEAMGLGELGRRLPRRVALTPPAIDSAMVAPEDVVEWLLGDLS